MASFLTDTFTEAGSTDIASHTPDVGGAWSYYSGSGANVGAGTGSLFIDETGFRFIQNAATPGSADYTITGNIRTGINGNFRMDCIARFSSSGGINGYGVIADAGSQQIRIIEWTNSTDNVLTSTSKTIANDTAYAFTFAVSGTSLSFTFDGTNINTTDATISSAGLALIGGRDVYWLDVDAATASSDVSAALSGSASTSGHGTASPVISVAI